MKTKRTWRDLEETLFVWTCLFVPAIAGGLLLSHIFHGR